jgi:hypothetical protein
MMIKILILILLPFIYLNNKEEIKPEKALVHDICNLPNKAFMGGEKLTYKLYYNWGFIWMSAAQVTFTVEEQDDRYILTATGKTLPSYNWFFNVEDYFYSHVDKKTLLPFWAKRDINEGEYKILNEINFNQSAGTLTSYVKKNDNDGKTVTRIYNSCMLDILSLVYKLRNIDRKVLSSDRTINFPLVLDDDVYELNFQYLGKEKRKRISGLGRYDTFKISPAIVKGRVFEGNKKMTVWISDDEAKIPLYLESPIKVGSVKAILTDYEKLRHPLAKTGN